MKVGNYARLEEAIDIPRRRTVGLIWNFVRRLRKELESIMCGRYAAPRRPAGRTAAAGRLCTFAKPVWEGSGGFLTHCAPCTRAKTNKIFHECHTLGINGLLQQRRTTGLDFIFQAAGRAPANNSVGENYVFARDDVRNAFLIKLTKPQKFRRGPIIFSINIYRREYFSMNYWGEIYMFHSCRTIYCIRD